MAARVVSWCRRLARMIRPGLGGRMAAVALPTPANSPELQKTGLGSENRTGLTEQCRVLHTTNSCKGLEEFFDDPNNWGEPTVKSGAPWTAKQLRIKSNEDLHKLWYVLLKEKNMLLTIEQEAKRQRLQMPSPERLKKVERSMARIDSVVQEREDALRLLQTGQEKSYPGAWRRNIFGQTYWYKFREWPIPWYLNKVYRRKRFYTPSYVDIFVRRRIEKYLRKKSRAKKNKPVLQDKISQVSAT
ncbi:39S ribosomal protein L47, mitochondrial [Pristis pectinata]|uniref:39S ribosomal protein L47, mitochondrial n=1 Tax=Pristis pectinata TaxID=685728 RepID=UPI00223D3147|nr:39S ribosomal protein L47, mitochondrial [Pristis pectinata]